MSKPSTELALVGTEALPAHAGHVGDVLFNRAAFQHLRDLAETLAGSQLIPPHFRGKWQDVLLACAMAQDMGENPLVVLQGMHVIQGRAGFSAQFMIARINASGKLRGGIRYRETGEGDSLAVTAYATAADTGETIEMTVSLAMARAEGWTQRNPKWKSIPQLMLRYRSAAWLVRTHFPEVMRGYHEVEELRDIARHPLEADYIDPSPSSSPPRERPDRMLPAPAGVEHVGGEDDLPSVEAPLGGAPGANFSAGEEGSIPLSSRPLPPSSAPPSTSHPPGPDVPAQEREGADLEDERAKVLAEVAALREECPLLLREQAQAMGLKTPSRAPTAKLRELVAITRGRRPLVGLPDAELLERIGAAWGNVADHDWALTLAEVAGLPISDKGPVLDGAPRPMLERYLVTLLLAVEQQQTQRQDTAVREALLTQAREVLADMNAEVAEEALLVLRVATLEDCDEEQLREFVRQAGGGA